MSKDYAEAVNQLTKLKDDPTLSQSNKLKERAAAIVRTFGDNEMKETFNRLTKFRATTQEPIRREKTINALDIMIHEFKLKQNKVSVADNEPTIKKTNSVFWTSRSILWVVIPIVFALIGGAYKLGFDLGYVKYDKEKIDLQKTIDALNLRIKELEEEENSELKTLRIENKNLWDTYHKLYEENEKLKKKK